MAKLMFTGSDVLFCTRFVSKRKFPTKRSKLIYMFGMYVFVKICDLFVEKFYVVSEHLIKELAPLKLKKNIEVLIDPPKEVRHIKKKPHKGFNILYYRGLGSNQVFKDWVYGYDMMQNIADNFITFWCGASVVKILTNKNYYNIAGSFNIIGVNGDTDMNTIYPIIDIMIRPNRHDGNPRMVMECEQLGIPYYWSKENPNEQDIIKFIEYEISKKNSEV